MPASLSGQGYTPTRRGASARLPQINFHLLVVTVLLRWLGMTPYGLPTSRTVWRFRFTILGAVFFLAFLAFVFLAYYHSVVSLKTSGIGFTDIAFFIFAFIAPGIYFSLVKTCPDCGQKVKNSAVICPSCKASLWAETKNGSQQTELERLLSAGWKITSDGATGIQLEAPRKMRTLAKVMLACGILGLFAWGYGIILILLAALDYFMILDYFMMKPELKFIPKEAKGRPA